MRFRHSVVLIIVLLGASAAFALSVPGRPANYVVDQAGIVDDRVETSLNGFLRELEEKTTAQVVVFTLPSLEGGSIEEIALMVAEKWALGQKDRDNGLLFLVAMEDRRYRFEVGYGLEGILPDSLVGSIGREYIVPNFRKGDYSGGIASAALAVAGEIARDSGVEITGMPKRTVSRGKYVPVRSRGKPGIFSSLISILFFIALIYLFIRHPKLLILLFLFSGMGGRRSSWGGGGGFGGGGFGGGGGGGFGGGGASGGW
jgi:uncharacterized protein